MSNHIPFIRSKADVAVFNKYYSQSDIVRIGFRIGQKEIRRLKHEGKLWLDTDFEGFHHEESNRDPAWIKLMHKLPSYSLLSLDSKRPTITMEAVREFVFSLLDEVNKLKPDFITVPQFPYVLGNKYIHKLNKKLATASAEWRQTNNSSIDFILPIIVTNKDQTLYSAKRNPIVKAAKTLYEVSDAIGLWVVDTNLDDQLGTGNFQNERFPKIIQLSQEIKNTIAPVISICGPYWGLNILIWAKGVSSHCAIGLGGSYRYSITGIHPRCMGSANHRIALPPLRRWAVLSPELITWLNGIESKLQNDKEGLNDFKRLKSRATKLISADKQSAKDQIAEFYKQWFDTIEDISQAGRSLALFQDLSAAFVMGRNLSLLPKTEKSARRPERIAEQLMFNCL